MIINKVFSNNRYIILPTIKHPKVYLCVEGDYKTRSFKLYQPFSFKAKLLKAIAFYFPYFNIVQKERSKFIKYLDIKFNKYFTASLYLGTDKSKAIIQLQEKGSVFGYLKIGITKNGNQKIKHEINALKVLNHINPVNVIDQGVFEGYNYFISEELKGNIGLLPELEIKDALKRLERGQTYCFATHPRILQIKKDLERIKIKKYINVFESIVITEELKLVYEHGDFTPWNIVTNDNSIKMFDFEYFVEDGLEYFDLIKYFYQIETLLNKVNNTHLIDVLLSKLDCNYNKEIIILFLLKEIIIKKDKGSSIKKENDLLKLLLVK